MTTAAYLEHHVQPAPSSQSLNARRLRYPATSLAPNSKSRLAGCGALHYSSDKSWISRSSPRTSYRGPNIYPSSPCASWPARRSPFAASQAGTRILYWVRGNYRVRDNLALSVAMWLSTKLRMPLQASTCENDSLGFLLYTVW